MRAVLFLAVFLTLSISVTFLPSLSLPAYAEESVYICPMHPHIEGIKGDSCPICGMTLVPKISDDASSKKKAAQRNIGQSGMGISINPEYVQALGVKTTKVVRREIGQKIRAYGRVTVDQGKAYQMDLKADGWVVDLKVSAVGDQVKAGDLLFTFYSPELMTAQSDYLIALKSDGRVGSAQNRLRLFGMTDQAIADLKVAGKVMEETPFYAPQNGVVTSIEITKGSHVAKGKSALRVDDLSSLWVMVDVDIKDAPNLEHGQRVAIKIPETGQHAVAVIDLVYPVVDAKSRTVPVRLTLNNEYGVFKPAQYLDVAFSSNVKQRLVVPEESVLYDRSGSYIILSVGDGFFQKEKIRVGIISDGYSEILDGLSEGDEIVRTGQFMIDAESHLRGGMSQMNGGRNE
ncbi:MAG: hypothetical protein AUJ12_01195 [Alphaproteobacteria bacterium CG1_02_46_17]|nr:MAG: hypothetical protein AUJ12_01195 [Alphaproteobacteria bacterium CG1_02_46_17]